MPSDEQAMAMTRVITAAPAIESAFACCIPREGKRATPAGSPRVESVPTDPQATMPVGLVQSVGEQTA